MAQGNRIFVRTATTLTGTLTLGAVVSSAFNTFADAGVADGAEIRSFIIEEGNDFEICKGIYNSAGPTLTRATVRMSRIGGVVGTTKMSLAGNATVRVIAAKEDILDPANNLSDVADQATSRGNLYAAPLEALAETGLLDNGGMTVDQRRSGSAVSITATGAYVFTPVVDRWTVESRGTYVASVQQVTDAPEGYTSSLKVSTPATPQVSIGTNDSLTHYTTVEGEVLARAKFGTASAMSIAFGFWRKSHRTGQYGGSLKNHDGTRAYGFSYTINAADTWEYKTVIIPGCTDGTWKTDNSLAAFFMLSIATGATLQIANGSWGTTNGSNVAGSVNGVGATTDAHWTTGVTGLVLSSIEVPSSARASLLILPKHRMLQRCKRYFQRWAQPPLIGALFSTSLAVRLRMPLPVPMRAAPTLTMGGTLSMVDTGSVGGTGAITSLGTNFSTTDTIETHANYTNSGMVAGLACAVYQDGGTTNYLDVDASI